jgi:cytochrome c oxidase subunit 2
MPRRVRRKLLVLLAMSVSVLVAAGTAAAANGGFTLYDPQSPNASRTSDAYYLILVLTGAIFVLVESLLVIFVWKYRSRGRGRAVEGAQVHGHTRLELIWTAAPVVILAVIAGFVFYKLPGITDAPAAANPVRVTIEGHQFYWQFDYPNGARSFNELHVPVGAVVDLKVVSADVIHSWWIPALGGKIQAIPGRTNHLWFQAEAAGRYGGQCAQLCGVYHASMTATVVAESRSEYDAYVARQKGAPVGLAEFVGVCATCHGMQGQGGYGPPISSSTLLAQKSGLVQLLRQGLDTSRPGAMPPVGNTWTPEQIDALAAYVKQHVYKGAASGG